MKSLHVLIADDEELARGAVVRAARARPETGRITECTGGAEAVRVIREGGVDLVFLDVRMPETDGFDVVQEVGARAMPPVVFVTAFDQFAIAAFEVRALDYLLKPFTRARFDEAFSRALEPPESASDRFDGLRAASSEAAAPDRLRIKTGGRTVVVPLQDVTWIEAANTYVRVHTRDRVHLLRASIGALHEQLDSARFVRVHRSAIVALGSVVELRPISRGDYEIVLTNGDCVRGARRRRAELLERLKDRTI